MSEFPESQNQAFLFYLKKILHSSFLVFPFSLNLNFYLIVNMHLNVL
jgi:hypothetical protein